MHLRVILGAAISQPPVSILHGSIREPTVSVIGFPCISEILDRNVTDLLQQFYWIRSSIQRKEKCTGHHRFFKVNHRNNAPQTESCNKEQGLTWFYGIRFRVHSSMQHFSQFSAAEPSLYVFYPGIRETEKLQRIYLTDAFIWTWQTASVVNSFPADHEDRVITRLNIISTPSVWGRHRFCGPQNTSLLRHVVLPLRI